MRIHHLNCGSLCPHGRRLVNGEGGWLQRAHVVCHCLAIEAGDGLVLVDTGFGTGDARNPARLGRVFRLLMQPRPQLATTALEQLRALGFEAGDVRHIVTTHLDLDHAGGLGDFPEAEVHVLDAELEAARQQASRSDRTRYLSAQWQHGPRWMPHSGTGGDDWFGFEGIRILPGIDAEILLVPLLGHSAGHTGVAIRSGEGWLLHSGDAYFHHAEIATPPGCPPMLRLFQNLTASDNKLRKRNAERLRELASAHGDRVALLCSHDPRQLELAQAGERAAAATG